MPENNELYYGRWGYSEEIEKYIDDILKEKLKIENALPEELTDVTDELSSEDRRDRSDEDSDSDSRMDLRHCISDINATLHMCLSKESCDCDDLSQLDEQMKDLGSLIEMADSNIVQEFKDNEDTIRRIFGKMLIDDNSALSDMVFDLFSIVKKKDSEDLNYICYVMAVIIQEAGDAMLLGYNRFRTAMRCYRQLQTVDIEKIKGTEENNSNTKTRSIEQIKHIQKIVPVLDNVEEKLRTRFSCGFTSLQLELMAGRAEKLMKIDQTRRERKNQYLKDKKLLRDDWKLTLWELVSDYYFDGKNKIGKLDLSKLNIVRNEAYIYNLILNYTIEYRYYYGHKEGRDTNFDSLIKYFPEIDDVLHLKKIFNSERKKAGNNPEGLTINDKRLCEMHLCVRQIEMNLQDFHLEGPIGYYTSFDTLEYTLPISATESNSGIRAVAKYNESYAEKLPELPEPVNMVGRFSIMHIGHMNDPKEGRTIFEAITDDQIFPDEHVNIEYPYVFLKSFTTRIDDLPMWEMYGDRSKGCCIVYKSEWSDVRKLLLKKVCYLREEGDKLIAKKEDNKSLNEATLQEINDLIKKLSELYTQYKADNKRDALYKIVQPIAYLFKNATYSHEDEYRIIRIEDEDSPDICYTAAKQGRLFVPSYQQTKISEIILGPKFKKVQDNIPYLQYRCKFLNEELGGGKIKIKVSKNEYI